MSLGGKEAFHGERKEIYSSEGGEKYSILSFHFLYFISQGTQCTVN
jgi:hypothetical protein